MIFNNIKDKFCIKIKGNRVINYLICGGITTFISFFTYKLFLILNIQYVISFTLSQVLAITFAYISMRKRVYNSNAITKKELSVEYIKFITGRVFTYFVNLVLLTLAVEILNLDEFWSNVVITIIVVILNYFIGDITINKIKNINKKKVLINSFIWIIVVIVALCTHHGFIVGHYSSDDYNLINIGYNEYSLKWNLKDGRVVMYLIDQIALRLNLSYDLFIQLTVILAILITGIVVVIFYNIICKYFTNLNKLEKVILILLSYVTHFNFMYVENLYFIESIVMALALLCYVISANLLVNKNKKIMSFIFSLIAIFCYNGMICYYLTVVTAFLLLKNRKNMDYKKVLKNIFIAGMITLLTLVINLIQVKLVINFLQIPNTRLETAGNVLKNIWIIFKESTVFNLKYTQNVFPKYLYMLIVSIILLVSIILDKNYKKQSIFFDMLLLLFISIFSTYLIDIVKIMAFNAARLRMSIGMSVGLLLIYILSFIKNDKLNKKICNFVIVFSILYFIIIEINTIYMINKCKMVNNLEKQEVLNLGKSIEQYEQSNNVNVYKITYVKSYKINSNYYLNGCFATSRSLGCKWSYSGVINFYLNRNFKEIETNEEIFNYYYNMKHLINENEGIICYNDILICPISDF